MTAILGALLIYLAASWLGWRCMLGMLVGCAREAVRG